MRIAPLPKLAATALILFAIRSFAQAPATRMAADAHPSFAVATVKPHDPDSRSQGFDAVGDRVSIRNQSVASLIMFAYSIHPKQIVDAPPWTDKDRFDILGTNDTPGEPSLHQQQEMLQKLLADRFGLKFHRDKRELSVYAIQIAKGGPKLKPPAHPELEADQEGGSHGTEMTVNYTNANMSDFILGEQFFLDRPIVDQTGLTGRYDFSIRYTVDEAKATDPNAPPGFFTAAQEQVGLKFEPTKASADVFVIDHVEPPSAN